MSGMGLSLTELCCLFCCPPCPSKIAAKLAFLPPEPTYSFEDEEGGGQKLNLFDKAEWQYSEREKVKSLDSRIKMQIANLEESSLNVKACGWALEDIHGSFYLSLQRDNNLFIVSALGTKIFTHWPQFSDIARKLWPLGKL